MKREKKRIIRGIRPVAAIALVLLLAGCGAKESEETSIAAEPPKQETPAPTETETPTPTPTDTPMPTPKEEPLPIIGIEEEGEGICSIALANATGKDIVVFAVETEYAPEDARENEVSDNLLPLHDFFFAGETRLFRYDLSAHEKKPDGQAKPDAAVRYNVLLEMNNGTTVTLHDVPFPEMQEGEICLEKGVAYLVYKTVRTGETVSTLDAEKAAPGLTAENVTPAAAQRPTSGSGGGQAAQEQQPAEPETTLTPTPTPSPAAALEPIYEDPLAEDPFQQAGDPADPGEGTASSSAGAGGDASGSDPDAGTSAGGQTDGQSAGDGSVSSDTSTQSP